MSPFVIIQGYAHNSKLIFELQILCNYAIIVCTINSNLTESFIKIKNMELKYKNITLRDYTMTDIEDEIRWFNEEREWIEADTPWEKVEPVNALQFRKEMIEHLHIPLEKSDFRNRLEIDVDKKHIGFVSSYPIDDDYNFISSNKTEKQTNRKQALGIEICESSEWGRGYGTEALIAYIVYHLDNGITNLYLETWCGNVRMMKCAEKTCFEINKREIGNRIVNNKRYDRVIYKLNIEKFTTKYL